MGTLTNLYDPTVIPWSAAHAVAVTPANDGAIDPPPAFLWVGGAGTLKMDLIGGETVTITLTAESLGYCPFRPTRVYATGTSASLIVACW